MMEVKESEAQSEIKNTEFDVINEIWLHYDRLCKKELKILKSVFQNPLAIFNRMYKLEEEVDIDIIFRDVYFNNVFDHSLTVRILNKIFIYSHYYF